MKKEYQIVVEKMPDKWEWYTPQYRNIYFLFRGNWKALKQERQISYEDAIEIINENITNKFKHHRCGVLLERLQDGSHKRWFFIRIFGKIIRLTIPKVFYINENEN